MDTQEKIAAGLLLAFVALIAFAVYGAIQNNGRLLQQCLADGRKEYECVAMQRGHGSRGVVPVMVPIRPR